MHDVLPVRVIESGSDCLCVVNGLVDRQLLLAVELLAKRLAFDVRHHVVKESIRFPTVEKRKDVRMIQARRELYLRRKRSGPREAAKSG